MQGYDMEDAMILNKASVERGLAHASVYKTEVRIRFLFIVGCVWYWFLWHLHNIVDRLYHYYGGYYDFFSMQLIDLTKKSNEKGKATLQFGN